MPADALVIPQPQIKKIQPIGSDPVPWTGLHVLIGLSVAGNLCCTPGHVLSMIHTLTSRRVGAISILVADEIQRHNFYTGDDSDDAAALALLAAKKLGISHLDNLILALIQEFKLPLDFTPCTPEEVRAFTDAGAVAYMKRMVGVFNEAAANTARPLKLLTWSTWREENPDFATQEKALETRMLASPSVKKSLEESVAFYCKKHRAPEGVTSEIHEERIRRYFLEEAMVFPLGIARTTEVQALVYPGTYPSIHRTAMFFLSGQNPKDCLSETEQAQYGVGPRFHFVSVEFHRGGAAAKQLPAAAAAASAGPRTRSASIYAAAEATDAAQMAGAAGLETFPRVMSPPPNQAVHEGLSSSASSGRDDPQSSSLGATASPPPPMETSPAVGRLPSPLSPAMRASDSDSRSSRASSTAISVSADTQSPTAAGARSAADSLTLPVGSPPARMSMLPPPPPPFIASASAVILTREQRQKRRAKADALCAGMRIIIGAVINGEMAPDVGSTCVDLFCESVRAVVLAAATPSPLAATTPSP